MTATFSYGTVLGPVTGGWLGEMYGLRRVYFFASAVFVLSTAFILFIQKQPIDHHDTEMTPVRYFQEPHLHPIYTNSCLAFAVFCHVSSTASHSQLFGGRTRVFAKSNGALSLPSAHWRNAWISERLWEHEIVSRAFVAHFLVACFVLSSGAGRQSCYLAVGYFLLGGYRAFKPLTMAHARGLVHDFANGINVWHNGDSRSGHLHLDAADWLDSFIERDPVIESTRSLLHLLLFPLLLTFIFTPKDFPCLKSYLSH